MTLLISLEITSSEITSSELCKKRHFELIDTMVRWLIIRWNAQSSEATDNRDRDCWWAKIHSDTQLIDISTNWCLTRLITMTVHYASNRTFTTGINELIIVNIIDFNILFLWHHFVYFINFLYNIYVIYFRNSLLFDLIQILIREKCIFWLLCTYMYIYFDRLRLIKFCKFFSLTNINKIKVKLSRDASSKVDNVLLIKPRPKNMCFLTLKRKLRRACRWTRKTLLQANLRRC